MAANTIEARLRIALQVAEAIKGLRQVKRELQDTGAAAASAGSQTVDATGTQAVVRQARQRSEADQAAAAAAKQALKDKTAAERAAARETKRLLDEEAAAKRKAASEEQRRVRDAQAAQQKTAPSEADQAAAAAKQALKDKTAAERAAARETKRLLDEEAAAKRKAASDGQARQRSEADQAAAAAKQALKDKTAAERAAARETKRLLDEEAAAKRKAASEEQRRVREAQAAQQKTARGEAYKKAALAPQITDIAVGLATGQNPLTVALQQGGQLKDLYGGIGPAARAVLSVFTVTRVVVGGIVAGLAAAVYEIKQGYDESQRLNKSLALTGNVANTSLAQIGNAAKDIAEQQGVAIGGVRDTIEAVLKLPGQTDTTFKSTAESVEALKKLTGESSAEAVKQFADQSAGVTAWATKANQAYNFLTADQVAYIRVLESQGRTSEAIKFTNEELTKTLAQRTAPAIGLLEKAWQGVGNVLSRILDNIRAIGRDTTPEDRIAELQAKVDKINQLRKSARSLGNNTADVRTPAEDELEAAQRLRNADLVRGTERVAAQRAENERIYRKSKEFQDSLASLDQAATQERLAQRHAALSKEQAQLDLAHERELVSEGDYALRSNAIEQKRIEAQVAAARKQLEIENGRVVTTPGDVNNRRAAVKQAGAQLIALQSELQQTAAKADQLLAAEARQLAADATKAWQDAYAKIQDLQQQNAATAARLVADPGERARLEAEAQTRAQRDELERSRRTLQLQADITIDPATYAKLQAKVEKLVSEGTAAIDEADRRARFESLQKTLAERVQAEQQAEQAISDAEARGAITSEEAEQQKFDARAKAVSQLQLILDLLQTLARTDDEKNAISALKLQIDALADTTTAFQRSLRDNAKSGLADFFTSIETGAKSGKQALLDMVGSFAKAMLNVINQRLAEQLVNQFIGAGGGGGGNFFATAASYIAGFFHTGGVIGSGGVARAISPLAAAAFAGAQVLHGGGMVGLRPDERPVIAQVGEEMLTADDPRHRNNYRSAPVIGSLHVSVSTDGTGSEAGDRTLAEGLKRMVSSKVQEGIREEMRPGGLLEGARGRV